MGNENILCEWIKGVSSYRYQVGEQICSAEEEKDTKLWHSDPGRIPTQLIESADVRVSVNVIKFFYQKFD